MKFPTSAFFLYAAFSVFFGLASTETTIVPSSLCTKERLCFPVVPIDCTQAFSVSSTPLQKQLLLIDERKRAAPHNKHAGRSVAVCRPCPSCCRNGSFSPHTVHLQCLFSKGNGSAFMQIKEAPLSMNSPWFRKMVCTVHLIQLYAPSSRRKLQGNDFFLHNLKNAQQRTPDCTPVSQLQNTK